MNASIVTAYRRRVTVLVVATLFLLFATLISAPRAGAEPAICDAPGLPPCAPTAPFGTLTPDQYCFLIMWRTLVGCNIWGVKVPEGTPGSWG